MTDRINVAEYHGRPLVELEFPDGVVWKLRQPLESDYYRIAEEAEGHNKRVKAFAADLAAKAEAKAAAVKADGGDGDAAAAGLIVEEGDEERLPLEVTERYQRAVFISIFIQPEQSPAAVLERLGPDIMNELAYRLTEILGGDAAKKRVAASSPVRT
jgi:hypothetical protein